MSAPRLRAALRAAGVSRVDPSRIEHIARGTHRVRDGSRLLACKLFDGPQAGARARTEGAAYAALAARGGPVPRLLAVDEANAAVVREWVVGPTLAKALRGEAAPPAWEQATVAWDALLTALDTWTEALDPARVKRAHCLRQTEITAVAESVIASAALERRHPVWPTAAGEIRRLAETISTAPIRTVPLDLNPGNVVLGDDGIRFVDLEVFGLDFANWSLCKATMLPGDPSSGRAGQALLASHVGAPHTSRRDGTPGSSPQPDSSILASALLLALADAAGLWRSDPAHAACTTLARELSTWTSDFPRLAAALV